MTTSFLKSILTAAVVTGACASSAQAVTFFSFGGLVLNGPLAGEVVFGDGSYDDTLLTMSGDEFLNTENDAAFTFSLTFFNQIFTAADDIDAPGFPRFGFTDGVLDAINFFVYEFGQNPVPILVPGVFGLFGNDVGTLPDGSPEYNVTLQYAAIPLPASLALAIGGLAALGALRARRRVS